MPEIHAPIPDHDLLIRLETMMNTLLVDVKELKDGTATRIASLEVRTGNIERIHDEVNPKEMKKDLTELSAWKRDQQVTWKVTLTIASVVGAVVGFITSQLSNVVELINKTH